MINKLFTFLAKQHMCAYVLCGMFFALLFVSYVDSHSQKDTLKKLIYPGIFIIIAAGVLVESFYEKHERGGKKIPINRYGIVMKDDYFPVKITSNISVIKKTLGYSYVIFRVACIGLHGFVLGLPIFMLLLNA